jgi:hypothetical protein
MTDRRALPLLLLLASAGCEFLWNAGNRGALKRNVGELLERHGAARGELDCSMIGTTRGGWCVSRIAEDRVVLIARGLALDSGAADPDAEGACRGAGFGVDGDRLYRSARRAPSLKLQDGSAFERLSLYYRPTDGSFCVEVSYAYG